MDTDNADAVGLTSDRTPNDVASPASNGNGMGVSLSAAASSESGRPDVLKSAKVSISESARKVSFGAVHVKTLSPKVPSQ